MASPFLQAEKREDDGATSSHPEVMDIELVDQLMAEKKEDDGATTSNNEVKEIELVEKDSEIIDENIPSKIREVLVEKDAMIAELKEKVKEGMEQNKRLEGELNESRERSEAESIKLQKEKEKNSGHLKQIEELLANRKELEREISIQKQELKRRYTEIEIQKANFQVVTLSNVKLLSELDKERREKKQLETSSCDVLSCIASENEILQQQNLILAEDFADEQFDRQTVEAERVNEEERLAQLEQQNLTLHESCDVLSCIANESEILQQQNLILAEDFADEQFHRQMVEAERVNLEELLSQLEQQNLNLRQEIESVFPFMADENEILREQISELNDELQDERDRNDVLQRVMAIMARAHMRLGNGVARRARRGFGIGVVPDALG